MKVSPTYILVAILAIATLYFYQDPQSNGNSRLAVTRAVVEHGSFQIDSYLQQGNWESVDKAFYNGHYYGDKAIGAWLLAVPFYFVIYNFAALVNFPLNDVLIKHSLTALVMGSAFTIMGVLLYRIAALITRNVWKALLAALGISLGTMLWPYSAVYYGHVLAAMFLTIALYMLLKIKMSPNAAPPRGFFWAGMALGFAAITDYTTVFIIAGCLVYVVYFLSKQGLRAMIRPAISGAAGAIIPIAFMLTYDFLVFGNPLALGYSYEATPLCTNAHPVFPFGFSLPDPSIMYHLTVDPRFGVLWQSPVLLLVFIGLAYALKARRMRAEVALSLFGMASLILMDAGTCYWWGGSAFGPRYLIAALPLLIVPLTLVPDQLIWLLGVLAALSAGQMLIPLLGKIQVGLLYDAATNQFTINQPFNGFSILYQYGIPIISKLHQKGTLPWTFGSAIGLPYRLSAALLVAVEGVLVGWLYKVTRAQNVIPTEGNSPQIPHEDGVHTDELPELDEPGDARV